MGIHSTARDEYDRSAAHYDRRWSEYNRRSRSVMLDTLGSGPLGRVLDLGCGTGNLLPAVRSIDPVAVYVGVDASSGMTGVAARSHTRDDARWLVADALRLPFGPREFDLVISGSAVHFVDPPEAALAEARRVLRTGGRLVLMDWAADHLPVRLLDRWLQRTGRSAGAWTRAQAAAAAERAGFGVRSASLHRLTRYWRVWVVDAVAH